MPKEFMPKRSILYVLALSAAVMIAWSYISTLKAVDSPLSNDLTVRVLVVRGAKTVKLSSETSCRIIDVSDGGEFSERIKFTGAGISFSGDQIYLGDHSAKTKRVMLIPVKAFWRPAFTVNGVKYRGNLEIILAGGAIDVVDHVKLEIYLRGVLPREMNQLWPVESLKAQAIASRSYALSMTRKREGDEYDLSADSSSQVYGGASAEQLRSNWAIALTRGEILAFKGKLLPGYFHSCCGGMTENMANVWNKGLAPFKGVKCGWCRFSPYYRWQIKISPEKLNDKLSAAGFKIGKLDDIKAGERDGSGRIGYVSVKSGGKWLDIKTSDFISAVGERGMRSTKMWIHKFPFPYRFDGYGWGHGVGMCQWGAIGMGLRWMRADQILKFYYPGRFVTDVSKV